MPLRSGYIHGRKRYTKRDVNGKKGSRYERKTAYREGAHREGVWQLIYAFFAEDKMHINIDADTLTLRTADDQGQTVVETFRAAVERDLRRFDIDGLWETLRKTREDR